MMRHEGLQYIYMYLGDGKWLTMSIDMSHITLYFEPLLSDNSRINF